ncbi:DUF1127 domain-containing protein [Pseudomonas veronii]|nr:DUF1127 domain-containing protein [Pseudomonas veronii]
MYFIRNICWIDHSRRHTLASSPREGEKMKGQTGCAGWTKRPLSGLFQAIARWQVLRHERRLVATLSDAALKDIGLSRADVEHEAHRHFWEDPLRK